MLFNIIGFACGLIAVVWLRSLPSLGYGVAILILLMGGYFLASKTIVKRILIFLCWFLAGFTWNNFHAQQWLNKRLPDSDVGRNISVKGTVVSLPINNPLTSRFLFRTSQFDDQPQQLLLQLNWQNPHPPLMIDDEWQLTVRVKPPHGLVNINGFNKLRWFFQENIHGTGYVINQFFQPIQSEKIFSIGKWRQHLQQEIMQSISDPSIAAIITALTVGVENYLADQDWQTLRNTGTVHLVVIAGLHIGLVSSVIFFLVDKFWRCFPGWLLRYPAQQVAAISALIVAFIYGALAGFAIPTQRALVMIFILMMGHLFYFKTSVWRRIGLAFWLVIIIKPGALFEAGFWLSFSAVIWIAYIMMDEWHGSVVWQWLRVQWGLFLGLMPFTLYYFQQFSLVSCLANLPAIIWIGWVVVPLCLLAALLNLMSLAWSQVLFKCAAYLLIPLWHFLQWIARWSFASYHHYCPHLWMFFLALTGGVYCLAPKRFPGRWLGLLGFIPIWIGSVAKPQSGELWLTMLDVGQGLSIVVQTATHLMIYDTGSRIPQVFDAGQVVILPYLQTVDFKKIDLLMISHGDNDHSGGAYSLLSQWPVSRILTSRPDLFSHNKNVEFCHADQRWQWDGIYFQVLGPPINQAYRGNNSSCVLQIEVGQVKLLLPGDIESSAEEELIAKYGSQLQSNILIVPHHGSRTSSTSPFLQRVQPAYALFSLGYYNRFHFPAPPVIARYQQLHAQQFLTNKDGAVSLHVNINGTINVETANPHRYFWQN